VLDQNPEDPIHKDWSTFPRGCLKSQPLFSLTA